MLRNRACWLQEYFYNIPMSMFTAFRCFTGDALLALSCRSSQAYLWRCFSRFQRIQSPFDSVAVAGLSFLDELLFLGISMHGGAKSRTLHVQVSKFAHRFFPNVVVWARLCCRLQAGAHQHKLTCRGCVVELFSTRGMCHQERGIHHLHSGREVWRLFRPKFRCQLHVTCQDW